MSLKQSPSRTALEAAQAATRLARQVAVALGDLDLSPSQYRLLLFLSEGNAAASAVAGRLAVSRPSVTALADGLERRGLLQRKSDPADRRKVAHELTDAGKQALAAADDAVAEQITGLAAHLDADEADQALEGLALWNEALTRARSQREAKK
ncbi:MarR family winged helix-turn-helix transcriptional regulator [Candidatus Poriferisocius sp.]|uniref:MarR family winged helix-turn-helix transcriptional regulator n=1 Tax=Candidatus Poriferisocius sp. TaxID=3101276 RepID=UPI003B01CC32